jgi:hypothetical protein
LPTYLASLDWQGFEGWVTSFFILFEIPSCPPFQTNNDKGWASSGQEGQDEITN